MQNSEKILKTPCSVLDKIKVGRVVLSGLKHGFH